VVSVSGLYKKPIQNKVENIFKVSLNLRTKLLNLPSKANLERKRCADSQENDDFDTTTAVQC